MTMDCANDLLLRQCRVCRRELPLDAEHFHRHAGHKNGFREVCKECRQQFRRKGRREAYGRAERTLLLRLGQNIRSGQDRAAHEEILYCLSQYFGGSKGIATAMRVQYDAARCGSQIQASIVRTIVALTIANDRRREAQELDEETKLKTMSDEELEYKLLHSMNHLLDKHGLEIVLKPEAGS